MSGASKRAGSSTSGAQTRRSTSKATSSRVNSGDREASTSARAGKRKRHSETPATTLSTRSGGAGRGDEREREREWEREGGEQEVGSESARPRKKRRTMVEVLLPPISSDEEPMQALRAKGNGTPRDKTPRKNNGTLRDEDDGEDGPPPKAKAKSERRESKGTVASVTPRNKTEINVGVSDGDENPPPKAKSKLERRLDVRSKGLLADSRPLDWRASQAKMESKVNPLRKERVSAPGVPSADSEDEDEDLRPPRPKKMLMPKRKLPEEEEEDLSEKEVEPTVLPIKVGPPRGIKRQGMPKKSGSTNKLGPSRTKPRTDDSADERAPAEEIGCDVSTFGTPLPLQQKRVGHRASPPPSRMSILPVSSSARPHSPVLSPGALARLEQFDRVMADLAQTAAAPPPDELDQVPDGGPSHLNDTYDAHDAHDTFDPLPPPTPVKSKPKPSKPRTPNGLIVPETESSGNSQSQSQSQSPLKPPQPPLQPPLARDKSPRKLIDLPTIAVIAASTTSSSASPQDLVPPQKFPPPTNRPSKGPAFKIAPSTFRSTTNARPRVDDSEPPPSSIESFSSPKHVDKGKQRAVEDVISLSEGEDDDQPEKRRAHHKFTDSQLRKRGKELFDQAQLVRETEWQKNKKPKRLKPVEKIVNGRAAASSSKASPLPFTSEAESAAELRLEDVMDLSGGANDTTLDTAEHSEAKTLSGEERERLRIELRQEEEESTQEAMGIYPPPPVKELGAVNDEDAQMSPPKSPKVSHVHNAAAWRY